MTLYWLFYFPNFYTLHSQLFSRLIIYTLRMRTSIPNDNNVVKVYDVKIMT